MPIKLHVTAGLVRAYVVAIEAGGSDIDGIRAVLAEVETDLNAAAVTFRADRDGTAVSSGSVTITSDRRDTMDNHPNPEMFGTCKNCFESIEFRFGAWRDRNDKSICSKGGHHVKQK